MKLVIQSIILLVCGVLCHSAILRCRCLSTSKRVQPALIHKVQVFPPRPYCGKQELIVTLKNNKKVCLDPTHGFGKAIMEFNKQKSENQANIRTLRPTTTTTTTTTTAATAAPTRS